MPRLPMIGQANKMAEPIVAIIVAMAKDSRIIGRDNSLPWRIPGDMKFFKQTTMGKPIIMGRKTYESIGKPLPGRTNIVVTRDANWSAAGVEVFNTLDAAIARGKAIAEVDGAEEICIIGGAEIYKQALPHTDKIYLTEVLGDVEGDTVLSEFELDDWAVMMRADIADDPRATHKARLAELSRA